jgi:UrcA family protein
MPTKIQFTTLACATALAFAASAQAAPKSTPSPGTETISVKVSVSDLNLNQQAGMAVAHRRIRQAATLACGSEPPFAGLNQHRLYHGCQKAAVDDAMADLSTQVAALRDPESAPKATTLAANR